MNDAVVGLWVTGPDRGRTRQLFAGVYRSELIGIGFDSTESTVFVAVAGTAVRPGPTGRTFPTVPGGGT